MGYDAVETDTADSVLRYESPGLTAWSGHPSGDAVWFDYRDREVVVKNPDDATLTKMIAVARALGAHVEGDDSERYEAPEQAYDPEQPPLPSVTLFDRLASWVARKSQPASEQLAAPFRAGERVKDAGNHAGRVLAVDMTAEHGLAIRVRFDDGREHSVSGVAHGLERID